MRLWHKYLIDVLPRQQLIAQWREISAIIGTIKLKGNPNHLLVNPIMNYNFNHLITYAHLVKNTLIKHNYKITESVWTKIISLKLNYDLVLFEDLYKDWHNDRYLYQCYFNLQEKFDRGGISEDEFNLIKNKIQSSVESGEIKCLSLTI